MNKTSFSSNEARFAERRGASLIELLLFIGVATMMTGFVVILSLFATQRGLREEVMTNVEESGSFALEMITRRVQAAESVDATEAALILTMSDPDMNPTIIELRDGKILLTEGDTVSSVTPTNVEIEDLNFVLLGKTLTSKRGVTISFGVASRTPDDAPQPFSYRQQFRTTIAGR